MLFFLFFALLAVGNVPSAVGIQVCPTADAASFWADTGKDDGASMVQMKSDIPEIEFGDPLMIDTVEFPKQKDIGFETFVLVGAGFSRRVTNREHFWDSRTGIFGLQRIYGGPELEAGTSGVYVLGFYVEKKALFKHMQDMKGEAPPAGFWNL